MRSGSLLSVLVTLAVACGSNEPQSGPGGAGGTGTDVVPGDIDAPPVLTATCSSAFTEDSSCASATGRTFYVSSSAGSDTNDGLTEGTALASVDAVNSLALVAGDKVLFKCGDTWRGTPLVITKSGAACKHIVFGSYPAACTNQPKLSGGYPITGWTEDGAGIWKANLAAGDNAGKFPKGINGLFRGEDRLPMGRWPNLDDATHGGLGYSFIDSATNTSITDADLPAADWTGAVIRAKTIRWLLLSRRVTGSSGKTLNLGAALSCWTGNCAGWGFHITNHRATLDVEGEWYFDAASNTVYLASLTEPNNIEGAAIPASIENLDDMAFYAAVVLGEQLKKEISYVVVENLRVENQPQNGISTPVNLETTDNHHLVIRCNTVRNVEYSGIAMTTWVWNAGADSDWRGGHDLIVSDNVVQGANRFGIHSYAYNSTFANNVVSDIGQIQNLTRGGLGCTNLFDGDNCTENGAGIYFPRTDNKVYATHDMIVTGNRVTRAGGAGILIFGHTFSVTRNVVKEACSTKGDCGGIGSFGYSAIASSPVHDLTMEENIVTDVRGITPGDHAEFKHEFGFGFYIDMYSANVTLRNNVVARTTAASVLYQNSTGAMSGNILFDSGDISQLSLAEGPVKVSPMTDNVFVSGTGGGVSMRGPNRDVLAGSNNNTFVNQSSTSTIVMGQPYTLAAWQSASGQDAASTQPTIAGTPELFVNDTAVATTIALTGNYQDLSGAAVASPLALAAYSGKVLVKQ